MASTRYISIAMCRGPVPNCGVESVLIIISVHPMNLQTLRCPRLSLSFISKDRKYHSEPDSMITFSARL